MGDAGTRGCGIAGQEGDDGGVDDDAAAVGKVDRELLGPAVGAGRGGFEQSDGADAPLGAFGVDHAVSPGESVQGCHEAES